MKTEKEILIEAKKIKNMGSPVSIENLIKIITKKENGISKRMKKRNKKCEKMEAVEKTELSKIDDMGSYNRANALKNLPSSMRW